MYLRLSRNAKGVAYLQIARSYREGGKVKREILLSLGRLDVLQATGQIDSMVKALSRFATHQHLIDLSKDISVSQVYHLGAGHVVSKMLERLGLKRMLERLAAEHPRMKLPWVAIITGMIVSRFIKPCSKRRLNLEQWDKIYPGILETDAPPLKSFYRAMDVLWKHRDDIEATLFDRGGQRDLFNQELDVVFYDLTTLHFESTNDDDGELRRFGYSKIHRKDLTQVILGLLVDREGVPVGYQLFPGNTYEPHSLPSILERLKTKYHVTRVVLVADRGIITKDNLAELRKAQMEFILGMKLWSMTAAWQAKVMDKSKYRALNKDGSLLIREIEYQDSRLIVTWSQERAERDAFIREEIVKKIREQLAKKNPEPKQFVTHKGYRQFLKGLDEGTPVVSEQAIGEAKKRDGFFGVLTNVAGTALRDEEVYDRYRDLWRVEDAFGEIKGPIQTRPMFHWVDPRIQSHVLLCLLAYYVEAILIRDFRKAKAPFTVGQWFRALNEVYAIPVDVRGTRAWVRNEIKGIAVEGYELMRLKLPDRVLKIEKIGPEESVGTQKFSEISKSAGKIETCQI
ncbi:MAG: IS1634 family transposase [bacterium]|nr:IS1634 family transposase [bacterium]